MVGVLVGPRTVWLEYWLDPGLYGWSTRWTQDCMYEVRDGHRTVWMKVRDGPRTVWIKNWLDPGMYGWSTGWTQDRDDWWYPGLLQVFYNCTYSHYSAKKNFFLFIWSKVTFKCNIIMKYMNLCHNDH